MGFNSGFKGLIPHARREVFAVYLPKLSVLDTVVSIVRLMLNGDCRMGN